METNKQTKVKTTNIYSTLSGQQCVEIYTKILDYSKIIAQMTKQRNK